jgi:response regulator NasT
MPRKDDIQHSILIVSTSEQFDTVVKRSLPEGNFMTVDYLRSASSARRNILERFYDIVVINTPLVDENGVELAIDIAEDTNISVLVVTSSDIYGDVLDRVTDSGVLAIQKPFPRGLLNKSIRYLVSTQNRIQALSKEISKAKDKLEEIRVISRAKVMLVEKKNMTEDEAHKFIGNQAMNDGVSRKRAAERIMDDLE